MASEWISIFGDGQDMSAYFSQPETTGKVPGVIVIMEAFGVNKHLQEVTDNPSRRGYVAVAPVLYHRLGSNPLFSYTGEDANVRTTARGSPRDTELTRDLNTTLACLKGRTRFRVNRPGDERPSYQAEAARDAWGRTLSWFQTYLKA
jgi:carboxymethylenebutenolidase